MKKWMLLTLFPIFVLTACAPSESDYIALGEKLIRDSLKDPDSAKFDSFFHRSSDSSGYVCGSVNAKNSYGAYSGKSPYYVYIEVEGRKLKSHGPVSIISDSNEKEMYKYSVYCQ